MILKMIINRKQDRLEHYLTLSLLLHGIAWMIVPDPRRELDLNLQVHHQAPERFITVMVTAPESPGTTDVTSQGVDDKPKIALPKAKPKTSSNRVKRRRSRKRQALKVKRLRTKRKEKSDKPRPATPKPQIAQVQPEPSSSTDTSSPEPSTSVQSNETSATLAHSSTSHGTGSTNKAVKKQVSRSHLRGILKGYYRSLNRLMKKNRTYPRSARRLGLEGTVLLEMVVNREGVIIKVKVLRSSGHKLLDQAALAQVQEMRRVPQIPKELNRPAMTFQIPFEYRLQS